MTKNKNPNRNGTPSKRGKSTSPTRAPATLASILGQNTPAQSQPKQRQVKPEWRTFHKNLLELRERLLEQVHGLSEESAESMDGYGLHMADSGTDTFDRDFALSLLSSDQDALYEIEEALKRIYDGSYGVCEITGNPIPAERLEAIPWTRYTVQAQAGLERDGTSTKRRLGALRTIDGPGGAEREETEEPESSEEKPQSKRGEE